ncbi:hypothetical protein GY45DRAFT_259525 [Cubamyces sp. BRFM 1775]|nr:hypothetical protein GY45DRAFT_259525 [Cubamyces sp. BRFM 1775]
MLVRSDIVRRYRVAMAVVAQEFAFLDNAENKGARDFVKYLMSLRDLESLTMDVLAHPPDSGLPNRLIHVRGRQDRMTTAYLNMWWGAVQTAMSNVQFDPRAPRQPFGSLRRVRVGIGHMCHADDIYRMTFSSRCNCAHRNKDSEVEHASGVLGTGVLQRAVSLLPALQELEISVHHPCTDDRTWTLPAETLKSMGLPLQTVGVAVNIHCWSKMSLPAVLEKNHVQYGFRDKVHNGLPLWDYDYRKPEDEAYT